MNKQTGMKLLLGCLLLALVATLGRAQGKPAQPGPVPAPPAAQEPKKANERPATQAAAPAEPFDQATFTQMAEKCVRLETEAGPIELEMLPESAPETVRSFLNLVASSALDTTTFDRVVPGFVIQGGNLSTRLKQTPEIAARAQRTVIDEQNNVPHVRGIVSMARPDTPNGATTHFFILIGDGGHLNGTFAAFARVTKGMEAVEAINRGEVDGEKPLKPVRLTRATIFACTKAEQPQSVPPEQ
jgi:peptidyl-prolyl cis-trans isomerase B (cyclophilin B)